MNLTKRTNGIWMVEFRTECGKRRRVSTGKRDKAEAMQEAHRILSGKQSRVQSFYTVADALDAAWETNWKHSRSARAKRNEVEIIRRYWDTDPVAAVTYKLIQEWVGKMQQARLSASTINSRLSALSVALREAANLGHIDTVPRMPRVPVRNMKTRYLTEEEESLLKAQAARLNAHADRPQGGGTPRYPGTGDVMVALIDALLQTGCRLSEVLKASPADMVASGNEHFGHMLVLPETKNGRPRSIPLTRLGATALRRLFEHETWKTVTERVAESDTRLCSARDWCQKRFTTMRNAAGLRDVSLHTLRHTAASRMIQRGVTQYQVQKVLGHSSPAVTQRYAHLNVDSLWQAVEVLDPQVRESGSVVSLRRA